MHYQVDKFQSDRRGKLKIMETFIIFTCFDNSRSWKNVSLIEHIIF